MVVLSLEEIIICAEKINARYQVDPIAEVCLF